MSKTIFPNIKSSPIFLELREQKLLFPEIYDSLWKVMKKLGYSDFLTREQGLITLKFLNEENVFGVLPTAGGKSFTFQTVARMTDGLTIVISPLIALMKDQASKHPDGASIYFNSDLSLVEKKRVQRQIRKGDIKLLYISPERLKSTDFKDLLTSSSQRVRRIVIDEAHCVVEWGYGFRVKYLHIAQEIDAFEKHLKNKIPVLLLTATASPWLQHEIVKNLQIDIPAKNFIVQEEGIDRPELVICLRSVKNGGEKVRWIANQFKRGGDFYRKRGIIFSAFADGGEGLNALNAQKICNQLEEMGVKRIGFYHGGMGLDDRRRIQNEFQNGNLNILVATKAFGMGIDLPKLDFIIHFYPPISLEEYWQEAGRGGRGMNSKKGEHCQCVVLHNPSDYGLLQGFPNLASFEKILSTFTSVVQGEIFLNPEKIKLGGRLRKLLIFLKDRKDVQKLGKIHVEGITLDRWKLLKSASVIIKHIESFFYADAKNKTDQTSRIRSNLRLRANRRGKNIRIEHGSRTTGPALGYYNTELNWFTEPEIKALAMIDDELDGFVTYTRFAVLKEKLSRPDMSILARKISDYRDGGYAKLNYVFNKFLKAKRGKGKQVILGYLALKKKPV